MSKKKRTIGTSVLKPTLKCGLNKHKGASGACAFGCTPKAALDAALAAAKVNAHAAAQMWIAAQVCPPLCPIKFGIKPSTQPRVTLGRKHEVNSKTMMLIPKDQAGSGVHPPPCEKMYGVCVTVVWEAVVACSKLGAIGGHSEV